MKTVTTAAAICLFGLAFVLLFNVPGAVAASTTIGVSPSSGAFGKPFAVSLVIDGHGDRFNAAQATVAVSSGLAIQDLVLGDCNFSFLHTPSIQNPSFEGVILSTNTKYAKKCTVYTATLIPVAKGKASIALSKVSVKRYGDAADILSSVQNGTYTLTAISDKSAVLGTQAVSSNNGRYSVFLKVLSPGNTPVSNAAVILAPVAGEHQLRATTDKTGTVHFSNVQSGVYEAVVEENRIKIGETIINVTGPNHMLTLGITTQPQNPVLTIQLSYVIIGIVILFLAIIAGSFVVVRKRGKQTAKE